MSDNTTLVVCIGFVLLFWLIRGWMYERYRYLRVLANCSVYEDEPAEEENCGCCYTYSKTTITTDQEKS